MGNFMQNFGIWKFMAQVVGGTLYSHTFLHRSNTSGVRIKKIYTKKNHIS